MAFNFNWSPLAADTRFYERAADLLTTALNKSPKPPIIVDDIVVTNMNLGNHPPELDILEIGDIADDRFKGIFKMCYHGDAFLTLRTRVQVNPLNTFLSSTASFTSPSPLAAHSGLTLPISITLSDFKLSGFVILVFSKQKGLTIVFRNDPLESLKVSSTFDSISFVRDYLQTTIESQLRNLIMEELPSIIHRLSLRLFCPDQVDEVESTSQESPIDPFAMAPASPIDPHGPTFDCENPGRTLCDDMSQVPSLFCDEKLEWLSGLRRNFQRMDATSAGIPAAVWRVEAACDKPEVVATPHLRSTTTRTYQFDQARPRSVATGALCDASTTVSADSLPPRPALAHRTSTSSVYSMGSVSSATTAGRSRSFAGGKKQKRRVLRTPLRHSRKDSALSSSTEYGSESDATADSGSVQGASSDTLITLIPEEPELPAIISNDRKLRGPDEYTPTDPTAPNIGVKPLTIDSYFSPQAAWQHEPPHSSRDTLYSAQHAPNHSLLHHAWLSKMATEIARHMHDEKARNADFWAYDPDGPPPAYESL